MFFFFFNDPATTEIYTLSLHDALPIFGNLGGFLYRRRLDSNWTMDFVSDGCRDITGYDPHRDRKSTRLNSSHSQISYAVFCLKKKKKNKTIHTTHDSIYNDSRSCITNC